MRTQIKRYFQSRTSCVGAFEARAHI